LDLFRVFVMPGLDPGIYETRQGQRMRPMDGRDTSGHDETRYTVRIFQRVD
jgi:hypothetical protein